MSNQAKHAVDALLDSIEVRGVEVLEALVSAGVPRRVGLMAVSGRLLKCALDCLFLVGRTNKEIRTLVKQAVSNQRKSFDEEQKKQAEKAKESLIILPNEVH